MKIIRWILGKIILILDFITRPKKINREQEQQIKIDKFFRNHSIYQFYTCPFCVKIRRYIRKNSLNIELRDAKDNKYFRAELKKYGGKIQVPCLRIEKDNNVEWVYESKDIVNYFNNILNHEKLQ
jgi:glutaredoxin